jgi:hypothetical protein
MIALSQSIGYRSQKLIREQATRDAVIAGIREAARNLAAGDIFLVSFSGHGGQVPNAGADDEPDGQDETWCLFDGQLIDDELLALWHQFPAGCRILVVSDSCNSGTVFRMAPPVPGSPRVRAAPRAVMRRTYLAHRSFYTARQVEAKTELMRRPVLQSTVRLLAGCEDGDSSLDGQENGAFTGALLETWNFGRFNGDYARFHREILNRIDSPQRPQHNVIGPANPAFDRQRPFAIGDDGAAHSSRRSRTTRAGDLNLRATLAIERYLLDERPEELELDWRVRKPKTHWGLSAASTWRSIGCRIIENFNGIEPGGPQIDADAPPVQTALINLFDQPLGTFHQYLVDKAREAGSSRELDVQAEPVDAAE